MINIKKINQKKLLCHYSLLLHGSQSLTRLPVKVNADKNALLLQRAQKNPPLYI